MKKLLILDNGTISLYRFRKEVVSALIADGWQITVSAPDDGLLDGLLALGVAFINTPIDRHGTNPVRDFALLTRYRSLMRETHPDIVMTYTIKPNIYGNLAAKSLKIPVVSMVTGLGETFVRYNMVSRIVKLLYRMAFTKTARVLFLNREDMEIMEREGLILGRGTLLESGEGVNLDEFPAMEYPGETVVSFLYIGRIMRSKGICELIEASERLKAEYLDMLSVTLIGYHEGDIKDEVELADKGGIIRYAGFQQDIKPFVRESHCVVLPSYKEGLPVSLLEAAASARPVITTDIGGCREIVDDDVNGFVCKPQDVDSLYGAMKRFVELSGERRAEMGKASRIKAESKFDRRGVADFMIKLSDKVNGEGTHA